VKKITLLSSLALAAFLAGCNDTEEGNQKKDEGLDTNIVTIATGGASGPYNILGTTMADIYTKAFDVNSRTQTTGASVENINLLAQKKVEMAFVMADALSQALNGEVSFKEPVKDISQVATLYPNVVQIIAKKGSGIKTIEDLKGKRVAVGDQNSGVEVNARQLLEGHGLTYEDLKVDYLGYAEAADGLTAGTIDAAFLTSGLPNASVMELSETLDIELVTIDPTNVKELSEKYPYFISYEIPADTYGNKEPIKTAAVPNALVVQKDMSDDDVYELTKTFFENLKKLENSHQSAKEISIEAAQEGMIAPLHPGAKRYYDEQK
jgi:uncharacterized protein